MNDERLGKGLCALCVCLRRALLMMAAGLDEFVKILKSE